LACCSSFFLPSKHASAACKPCPQQLNNQQSTQQLALVCTDVCGAASCVAQLAGTCGAVVAKQKGCSDAQQKTWGLAAQHSTGVPQMKLLTLSGAVNR